MEEIKENLLKSARKARKQGDRVKAIERTTLHGIYGIKPEEDGLCGENEIVAYWNVISGDFKHRKSLPAMRHRGFPMWKEGKNWYSAKTEIRFYWDQLKYQRKFQFEE